MLEDMYILKRHHGQANIDPELMAAAQTLPLPQEGDIDMGNALSSTSMSMTSQPQSSVSLAWFEFLQLLTHPVSPLQ